jgi:hypothetical protein
MSVFETMPDPRSFLMELREVLDEHYGTVLYFEVPNANYMFDHDATWSIYYEQFGHFTQSTLADIFNRCGYEILDSGSCYDDDQYIFVEAKPAARIQGRNEASAGVRYELPDAIEAFARTQRRNIEVWRDRLERLASTNRKIVAWGAGGKGNSFLNILRTEKLIRYVVDINPSRQGQFIAGSAQEIVAPDVLADYKPDVIIVTNPIYEREIRNQVSELGISCEFVTI